MPKVTAAVLAALVALALTSCASVGESGGGDRSASKTSESAEPLMAKENPEPAPAATPDAIFLERVRAYLPEDTIIPDATDEQLLVAGEAACKQMNSGVDSAAVSVIEGETPNGLDIHESSAAIAVAAKETYCPQGY